MAGVDADHDFSTFVPPAAAKKRGGRGSRNDILREQCVDIEHALRELELARNELSKLPEGLTRKEREEQTGMPMSRLNLVRKYCEDVMRRNGWRRIEVK